MPAQNDNRTDQGSPTSGRKTYQAPRLSCYGDVGEITQQVATGPRGDGGGSGMTKTG